MLFSSHFMIEKSFMRRGDFRLSQFDFLDAKNRFYQVANPLYRSVDEITSLRHFCLN
jgi:hypothetical protein